jgi:hypothetical protein
MHNSGYRSRVDYGCAFTAPDHHIEARRAAEEARAAAEEARRRSEEALRQFHEARKAAEEEWWKAPAAPQRPPG